jgi:hypothetical protein
MHELGMNKKCCIALSPFTRDCNSTFQNQNGSSCYSATSRSWIFTSEFSSVHCETSSREYVGDVIRVLAGNLVNGMRYRNRRPPSRFMAGERVPMWMTSIPSCATRWSLRWWASTIESLTDEILYYRRKFWGRFSTPTCERNKTNLWMKRNSWLTSWI